MKKTLILLVLLAVTLTSCGTYRCMGIRAYSSYDECVSFIEEFKNNGCTTGLPKILFNLDNEELITNVRYLAEYSRRCRDRPFLEEIIYTLSLRFMIHFDLKDADSSGDLTEQAYHFYMVDLDMHYSDCVWNDETEIQFDYYINHTNLYEDELDQGYNYKSCIHLKIDENYIYLIDILSVQEITPQQLDNIFNIIKSNMICFYE